MLDNLGINCTKQFKVVLVNLGKSGGTFGGTLRYTPTFPGKCTPTNVCKPCHCFKPEGWLDTTPANQQNVQAHLTLVALPRKGKLSQQAQAIEHAADFVKARRQHSAVESAINALGVHGLDRCPDHGIRGFKRYVALAVVARNIHRIGALLREQEKQRATRKARHADHNPPHKLAA